jgi:hypothetical protein
MKQVLLLAAILSSSAAFADDPPGIVWERQYANAALFHDVLVASDGRILCSGFPGLESFNLWCLDSEGNQIWASGGPWYFQTGRRVVATPSGGGAVVGHCRVNQGGTYDLFVTEYSSSGQEIWTTLMRPVTSDIGYDITCLPGGGYAVCGCTQDPSHPELETQTWVLRLDSQGDTLWTRTWGPTDYPDKAFALEYSEGGITVLAQARPEGYSQGRPVLLRYSMEGDLLWVSTDMIGTGIDICMAGTGYCVLRTLTIARLSESGDILWEMPVIPGSGGDDEMHTIRQTMDDGFLVAGADDYIFPEPEGDDWNAHLSRYDQNGNWLWTSSLESGGTSKFYSATQLPQGGYLACGGHTGEGYLVKLEPETGIEQGHAVLSLVLSPCCPNPCTDAFSLDWSTGLSGISAVKVYDVSGRLRLDQNLGLIEEGEHTIQMDLQQMPSGCYLIVVSCGSERASTKLVLLR